MLKHRLKITVGFFLLMLMGIGLTISTLHSHHDLDLHNSADFADTGQCLTADSTVCPICAHLVDVEPLNYYQSANTLLKTDHNILLADSNKSSVTIFANKGRSPPITV
ncbi:hypothetical protein [Fodinibius halophilus]|uniref:Uncharacterized protein n=1 Tax=Fodinibius halophilus TaxID=1736908 RepID=A0A6M1T283_9BACT|nr:hypothetical protein [Fodinibius halophilus]NGP88117.1 hypothetical protein [Fodinibius halophilus]